MRKVLLLTILALTTGFTSGKLWAQAAGSLDQSFGAGGIVVTDISGEDKSYGVEIQSDGKIVVAGYSTSGVTGKDFTCVRYNADGSLDNTFGTGGIVITDVQLGSEDIAYDLAIQSDGKIILAGYSDDGLDREAALVRYNSDGSLDNTFGTGGIVLTDFDSGQQDEIKVVKIHELTGNIVVGGSSVITSTTSKPVIARYLSDGTLDNSFETNGIRLLWITSLDYQYLFSVEDLVVKPNGKISAVGWRDFPGLSWDSDYWAGRINSDGTMDATFSTDGVSVYNGAFNGHDRAYSMLLESNDNIRLSGGGYVSTLYYDKTAFEINANGSAGSWAAGVDYGATTDDISYSINEDASGRYVMAGSTGTSSATTFAISRVLSSGSLDNSFGGSGMVITTFNSNSMNECFDALIQPDDKIVATGYTGFDFAMARYLGEDTPMLDNFQLISPADMSSNQDYSNLVFNWTDAFGATSYEIDIDVNASFATAQTYTVGASTYTANGLQPNTQYFWRVRASDGSNWGQYSSEWSFTTNSLENFALLTPTNNAIDQEFMNLSFDWTNATGASSYELEIDTSPTFSASPVTYTASSSNYTVSTLTGATDYFWRVRASDGSTWGQWTPEWKFTTKVDDVSLDELESSVYSIYPNPTSSQVMISYAAMPGEIEISVFNTLGDLVATHTRDANGETIFSINGAPGVYLVKISAENGAEERVRLVKQ